MDTITAVTLRLPPAPWCDALQAGPRGALSAPAWAGALQYLAVTSYCWTHFRRLAISLVCSGHKPRGGYVAHHHASRQQRQPTPKQATPHAYACTIRRRQNNDGQDTNQAITATTLPHTPTLVDTPVTSAPSEIGHARVATIVRDARLSQRQKLWQEAPWPTNQWVCQSR